MYVWKRYYDSMKATNKTPAKTTEEIIVKRKVLDNKKLEELAKRLNQK